MALSELLSINPCYSLSVSDSGEATIRGPIQTIPLNARSRGLVAVLKTLFAGGATQDELLRTVIQTDGPAGIPMVLRLLQDLQRRALLCRTLRGGDEPLATLVPIGTDGSLPSTSLTAQERYALSRFVVHRVDAGMSILESPLSHHKIRLHHRLAGNIVFSLARFRSVDELAAEVGEGEREALVALLTMLVRAGMIAQQGQDGGNPEETAQPLAGWEFHEMFFHARSRRGRHNAPYGGAFRFAEQLPPPALKPAMSAQQIALDVPDIEQLVAADVPFTAVLERRRSVRTHGAQAITRQQLGHFLYRSARVVGRISTPGMEYTRRPYPAGGALYELEIYPIIESCAGLEKGMYHYRPLEHALSPLSAASAELDRIVEEARYTWAEPARPQVLLVITSCFPRISYKYQSMGYALSLKNLGALYQTMYLVAGAMGLAPCALGGGDSDLFARASGLDYLVEGSIGEFALGSMPAASQ